MPVGTTLLTLRSMLNAEIGEEMDETISSSNVTRNNRLLSDQQLFLANQHSYLRGKVRKSVNLTAGTQYYTLPTGIDLDRPEIPAYVNMANFRYRLGFGIGQEEYNLFRSDQGVKSAPAMRWDLVNNSGVLQIEIWPIPSVAMTLELSSVLPITAMTLDADTCVIDDLALVLFTAAELLARHQSADAPAKAAKAQAYLASLRASMPMKFEMFDISGRQPYNRGFYYGNNRRPVIATN